MAAKCLFVDIPFVAESWASQEGQVIDEVLLGERLCGWNPGR